jgi:uncharacterized radical SAM superfamily Fe-S cluster-containing enzyme
MFKKSCPEHGEVIDVYWSDVKLFKRALEYWYESVGLDNPRTEVVKGCPLDCGICPNHLSHTALALVDVTNRCNLQCPICFAAADSGYVVEPTMEEMYGILKNLRSNRPVPTPAVQFAGGEPTVSENLIAIIKMAKDLGFPHVEIATNGIRIANSLDYARKLKDAGLSTLYFQFDGLTPKPYIAARGKDLFPKKLQTIENCRRAGLHSIVLVPTLVRDINDDQVGGIIDFAVKNVDVVRCINFQPVSITGRINHEERKAMRITIPDLIHLTEEQTDGIIKPEDWFPVPSMLPVGRTLGLVRGSPSLELSCHPACGSSTFIVVEDDGTFQPITNYINIEKFLKTMDSVTNDLTSQKRLSKTKAKARLIASVRHFKKRGLVKDLLSAFVSRGDYSSLADFMRRVIMIGGMHFQDPYNIDLERVQRCDVNYGLQDGRIIPFCTMNSIHRPYVEKQFAMTVKEWKAAKGKLTTLEKQTLGS